MFFSKKWLCAVYAFAVVLGAGMLFTASGGQDIRFSDAWKFYQGDAGTTASGTGYSDASWATVYLPHTVRVELNYRTASIYYGVCWYRKTFTAAAYQGKKVFLEFEGAMQTADVWVNGTQLTQHLGGYTPFVYDITNNLSFTGSNLIAVRLDNNPSSSFPPGNSAPDFLYFGGLYRNAHLLVMDSLHITNAIYENIVGGGGIFVTTSSSGAVTVKDAHKK